MKNAAKYAEELRSLLKRLSKDPKVQPLQKQEPLKALVRGAMSYDVSDARAEEAMRLIDREFVDLNELRVATDLEIQELLGTRYPAIEDRVALITQSLNAIFEREHTLSLERLKTISKRDARQFLRDLPQMNPFVEAYVMLFALDAPCVPVDQTMLGYLRQQGVADEKTTADDAQKFIEHHVKAEECYDFYCMVRRAAADAPPAAEEKKKAKGK